MKTNNPTLYRRLSEPHESPDVANSRIAAFLEEVYAARERHHIQDALIVIAGNVVYPEQEGRFTTHAFFGDSTRAEVLAAYALGAVGAERRETVNTLTKGRKS